MATEDDSDVPDSGAVFTFGKSRFGDNTPSKFWIRNDRVVDISCGDEHTALVAASGRLFMFGSNAWGQLGLGHTNDINKPSRVKALKHEKVTRVACGRSHTLIATESGRLYTCGANNDHQLGLGSDADRFEVPKHVAHLESAQYKMLSAGGYHSAAITEWGEVWLWGACSEGQLGLGDSQSEVNLPTKLQLSEPATAVSCGYYHTALITESGSLFTFGESENGKLGLGEATGDSMEPCKVRAIRGKVRQVSCGGSHTVAVTEDGCVFTFGDGSTGQLGHGNTMLGSDSPVEVTWPSKTKIKSASCGENHTAFITDQGHMYSCGDGRHGKLAQGEEDFSNQFVPTYVARFAQFTVDQVSCGGCHMLTCATPRPDCDVDVTPCDEEQAVSSEVADHNILNKYRSHLPPELTASIDLSGSISARNRRRDKLPEAAVSLNRTLPTLSSSFSNKCSLDPLSGDLPTTNGHVNPLNRGLLPTITTTQDPGIEIKKHDSAGSGSENDMQKERQLINAQSTAMTHSAPKPRPRVTRSRTSDEEDSAHGMSEEEPDEVRGQEEEEPDDVDGEREEPDEVRGQEDELEDVESEEARGMRDEAGCSSDEEEEKIKEPPVASTRARPKLPEDSEEEDDPASKATNHQVETDEESDKETKPTKKVKKKAEKPAKKKKNVGMFSRKKLEATDEEEDEREDEESEVPKKAKRKTKKKAESEEEISEDERKATKKKKTKKKTESNEDISEDEQKTKKKKKKKMAESEEEITEDEKKTRQKKEEKVGATETEGVLEKKTKKIKFKDEVQAEKKRDKKTKRQESEDEEEEKTNEDKDDQEPKTKDDTTTKTEKKPADKPPEKKKSSLCTLL